MTREEVRRRIHEGGIVPVVRATTTELAVMAAGSVFEGGITVLEVTMSAPCALEAIADLRRIMGGDVVIGGGNVLDAKGARACLDAGAQFLTSPCFEAEIVDVARSADVLMIAGALTPTEVLRAWKGGADFVNVFPCGRVGGPGYIKSLKGAMPHVPMIPSGGVNLTTAAAFLDAGAAALGVGAELVLPIAVEKKNPYPITNAARQYVAILRQRRG
jgi:2-dehydro-3-deoxyphosphogluconate aldolase/(4S)-4-hydroxy-2-oxoglutarate aldolase